MRLSPDDAIRAALHAALLPTEGWAILFAKSRVVRRDVPLGFDPADYAAAEYDAVADYMAVYEALAAETPANAAGLRWRYHDRSVLFEMSRTLNAPYDDFVERVDIASAIRLMNDYIGGHSVVVSRNRKRAVTRQAERNMYLPQPNWLALSGGAFIDVCKLEVITYAEDRRRICWRTVHSPNGSAVHDDGSVTFERMAGDRTRVTVCGLQQFTLPPFWAAVDPWLPAAVKDGLVEESYRRFFTVTLDNFEACYEGREFRTGRDREPDDDVPPEERLQRSLATSLAMARELLPDRPFQALVRSWRRSGPEGVVDDRGFRHFEGSAGDRGGPRAPTWWTNLREWQDEWRQVLEDDARSRLPGRG